jgi:hypothetical protein
MPAGAETREPPCRSFWAFRQDTDSPEDAHADLPQCFSRKKMRELTMWRMWIETVEETGGQAMKNCRLCRYSALCKDLPGVCVLIPHIAVAVVAVAMTYLFITQELL